RAPIRAEREFGAAANRPAAWRCVLRERGVHGAAGRRAFERDAPEGIAAGGISEPTVGGVTDPPARRAEPVDIVFEGGIGHRSADRALGADAAFGIAPVKIGLRAQGQRAGLPVVADLTAADRAKDRGIHGREIHAADAESTLIAGEPDAE